MKNKTKILLPLVLTTIFFLVPNLAFSQVNPPPPSGGPTPPLVVCDEDPATSVPTCDFNRFIDFIQNLITFLIYISIPLAAIAFAWAGFILVTSGGSEEKKNRAKSIFTKTAFGFIFILAAWLIVYFISTALLQPGYILLQP